MVVFMYLKGYSVQSHTDPEAVMIYGESVTGKGFEPVGLGKIASLFMDFPAIKVHGVLIVEEVVVDFQKVITDPER